MKFDKDTKILIVGLGVIGGGYAAALTKLGYKVKCITKEQKDVDYAIEHGMICYGTTAVEEDTVKEAELIIFALYPSTFIEWVKEYQHLFSKGTLVTDVTGVKKTVVSEVQSILRPDCEFISAHPMAGRERSGVEFSDPEVFKGANYIVTPTEKNSKEATEICKRLGYELGFGRVSELSPERHDETVAFLSQLTHVIAVSLMNSNTSPSLERFTGDSFRDLTRIAKINDRMWGELFLMNKEALIKEMDTFLATFGRFREMLNKSDVDGMREMMKLSTKRRALFDKPSASKNDGK